jgi:hypothetical protein
LMISRECKMDGVMRSNAFEDPSAG